MVEERYQRIIEELQKKFDTLSDWEKGFLANVAGFHTLSINQKAKLDKMKEERLDGKERQKREFVKLPDFFEAHDGKVRMDKSPDNGWFVSLVGVQVGFGMTYADTKIVWAWIQDAWPKIEAMIGEGGGLVQKEDEPF